jgi:hypothetical protein
MGYYLSKKQSVAEKYQQMAKRVCVRKKFSKYRGVTSNPNPKKPYKAALSYQGRKYYLGAYETELEAARAYNEHAARIIGDHAILNEFPEGDIAAASQ